jgi:multidrug efflux pump subunit AcrA (membrane-fusion protein)
LTIADASSIVFLVDVSQNDLARVRPGQAVRVELAGRPAAVPGHVHAVLPGANPADFSGSVRVDLPAAAEKLATGLFGTARLTVGRRSGVLVVPAAAVIRDDVRGTSQIAAVTNGHAHWMAVRAGGSDGGQVDISGPGVMPGLAVIVSGMVGLPEGKSVALVVAPSGPTK